MTGEAAAAYRFLTQSLERPSRSSRNRSRGSRRSRPKPRKGSVAHDDAERHYRAALAASAIAAEHLSADGVRGFPVAARAAGDAVIELLRHGAACRSAPAAARARRSSASVATTATRVETLRYRLELALRGDDRAHAREAAFFALYLDHERRERCARARQLDRATRAGRRAARARSGSRGGRAERRAARARLGSRATASEHREP